MKRYAVLITVLMMATIAQAQQRTLDPEAAQRVGELAKQLVQQRQLYQGDLNAYKLQVGGAWWTNPALATRMGLTDDQKAKLQRAFENHRQSLTTNSEALSKEEAQLAKLLDAETIDRNAVLAQIDRVAQARSELERVNAAMTLEMREALTRAQWAQVPQLSVGANLMIRNPNGAIWLESPVGLRGGGGRGQRGDGARGDGQRNGGQRQQ
jgi:Spy/CpxP family protein refolding chaperone